jgi:hypothetical protein
MDGHDAGRFWLIPRNDGSGRPTQRYYHVPPDWLHMDQLNELVLFEDQGREQPHCDWHRSHRDT